MGRKSAAERGSTPSPRTETRRPNRRSPRCNRQPTPTTVARAEEIAGEVSGANLTAVEKFLQEARKADAANDLPACEKALAEVRKILGP
jgi:hypothetical protein